MRSIAVAVVVMVSLPVHEAAGQTEKATPLEVVQLPKFCYAQYKVKDAVGEEYAIHDCGPAMNHYCGGLLKIIRARGHVSDPRTRLDLLNSANISIGQTEVGMKDYPNCPLRDHVLKSKAEVRHLLQIYGVNTGAKK